MVETLSSSAPLNMLCFTPPDLLVTPAWTVCTGWDSKDSGKAQSETFELAQQHGPWSNESASTKVIRCKNSFATLLPNNCSHLISSLSFQDWDPMYLPWEGDTDRRLCQSYFRSVLYEDRNLRVVNEDVDICFNEMPKDYMSSFAKYTQCSTSALYICIPRVLLHQHQLLFPRC